MQKAWSARCTCLACLSASLYTATVGIPAYKDKDHQLISGLTLSFSQLQPHRCQATKRVAERDKQFKTAQEGDCGDCLVIDTHQVSWLYE
jgi:hypothetical protein